MTTGGWMVLLMTGVAFGIMYDYQRKKSLGLVHDLGGGPPPGRGRITSQSAPHAWDIYRNAKAATEASFRSVAKKQSSGEVFPAVDAIRGIRGIWVDAYNDLPERAR